VGQLKDKANSIFCGLFIYLVATSFINQDVYAFTVRFASVLIFLVLGLIALPYFADDIRNKDVDLILAVMTVVFTVIFVLATGSGYGAAFIPSDLALICYVEKRMRLGSSEIRLISFAGALPVILWYSHVRWSYNFNMAGFTFMIMAFFAMILVELTGSGIKLSGSESVPRMLTEYRQFIEGIIFVTAFILSMLYHSRTVMIGMIMFIAIYALFGVMSTSVLCYRILFLTASVGAAVFTLIYIKFAGVFGGVTFLYKDVFSGREGIWRELWGAFLSSPVTGIGSSYELKSFEIFEVHNGMFDILTVHGIIVFTLIIILLFRMFERCRPDGLHKSKPGGSDPGINSQEEGMVRIRRLALSAAFAMMFTSWFENFFTVPPYSIIFMSFVLIADPGTGNRG